MCALYAESVKGQTAILDRLRQTAGTAQQTLVACQDQSPAEPEDESMEMDELDDTDD